MNELSESKKRQIRREHLGDWLKDKRLAAKLTQWDIAHHFGFTSAQYCSNWERGVAYPPEPRLAELAKLIGVSAKEMVEAVHRSRKAELDAWHKQTLAHVLKRAG